MDTNNQKMIKAKLADMNNNNLKNTLKSNINMDNILAYAIANRFGGLSNFDEMCSTDEDLRINRNTKGFSQDEVVAFYHKYKPSLLNYLTVHSKNNGYICGFDWVDSAMTCSGYDRDDIAAAMYEGLIDDVKPSNAHIELAVIVVEIAVNSIIEAHQELMSGATA